MKKLLIYIFSFAILGVGPAHAADLTSNIPDRLKVVLDDLVDSQYTPEVISVAISPEKPGPKDAIKVSAVIRNDANKTSRTPVQAWIAFVTKPGEIVVSQEMKRISDELYEITIGPFEAGTNLQYAIRAIDSGENLYMELPCQISKTWPPFDDACFQNGAQDLDPDDSDGVVGPNMDILNTKYGENATHLFFELEMQGKIVEGTINPPSIHAHILGIVNTDVASDDLLNGYLPVYAPLSRLVQIEPCTTIYRRGGDAAFDSNHIRCELKENRLMFSMSKTFYRANPSNLMKFMMATGILTNLDPIDGVPKDYTQITAVKRITRTLKISD